MFLVPHFVPFQNFSDPGKSGEGGKQVVPLVSPSWIQSMFPHAFCPCHHLPPAELSAKWHHCGLKEQLSGEHYWKAPGRAVWTFLSKVKGKEMVWPGGNASPSISHWFILKWMLNKDCQRNQSEQESFYRPLACSLAPLTRLQHRKANSCLKSLQLSSWEKRKVMCRKPDSSERSLKLALLRAGWFFCLFVCLNILCSKDNLRKYTWKSTPQLA